MESDNPTSPPEDMDKAAKTNSESVECKRDLMEEILDDLSVILMCKERAQADRPLQGTRWQLYAVFAYGFVTLKIRDVLEDRHLWETRPFVRKYPLPKGCDVEELKTRLAKIGVETVVPPPGFFDNLPEDANPRPLTEDGKAVDAVPQGDQQ